MAEEFPTNNQWGRRSGPCRLRRFGQGPSYSPNRLVSQSAMLYERSVQGFMRAKHKTHGPLDDQWVILSSSKAFNYFLTRQVLLKTCYSYSCKWRFNFNAKKSVVIMFEYTRTHVIRDRYQWYIGIETIPVVDSCKHLGITLDRRLTNACRVHEACSRARKSYFP